MKKLPPASSAPSPAGAPPAEASSPASSTPRLSTSNAQPPAIPDHELLRRIGGGSYGEVWLARSVMGTYRAVKIVHRHTFDHDRPFEREFAGIQKFEPISRSHEGLVDLLQVGRNEQESYFYYVMELADAAQPPLEDGRSKMDDGRSAPGGLGHSPSFILDPQRYAPKTLRSLLRPNPQPSTLNPQPTARLPLDECIQLGLSLAYALAYLHGQDLVHRDIKPSNIIFVGGVPKLADVGLVAGVDEARSYVGTEGFIPPEGPGTPQADLYSLGILLYQMSTGKSHQDFPEPLPDLAAQPGHARWLEFNAVVHKACAANPRERYQSAAEMHTELALLQRGESVKRQRTRQRRWGFVKKYGLAAAAALPLLAGVWLVANRFDVRIHRPDSSSSPASAPVAIKSIAVLPFDNDSRNKDDEYLGGQMAEALSSALTKIPGLRVLGRDTATSLNESKDRRAAAQQLKLDAVLVGRVRKPGHQLQVSAQLVNTADGFVLWSETYDREGVDIFGIQTDIAEKAAERLNLKLSDTVRTRLAIRVSKNLEAYQFYLEGRAHWQRNNTTKAIESFQSAIRLDTNFALAYAGLAESYMTVASLGASPVSPGECYSNALAQAEKAVRLDSTSAEAYASRALAKFQHYDWDGAEQDFRRAITLDPNYAQARRKYGKLLSIKGRFAEAITECTLAKELDPWSINVGMSLGWTLLDAREYDKARAEFQRVRDELGDDSGWGRHGIESCYFAQGRYDDAVALWEKENRGGIGSETVALTQAYESGGIRGYWEKGIEQALELLNQGQQTSAYWIASSYAAIGNRDEAFKWLDRAYGEQCDQMPFVALEYKFASLHSDPRFAALLKKMRLSMPIWKK